MFLLMQARKQKWPSYSTNKGDSGAASHDTYFSSPVATHGYSASVRSPYLTQRHCFKIKKLSNPSMWHIRPHVPRKKGSIDRQVKTSCATNVGQVK
jgi:hypothetical protein